eukprot:sb/3474731/
MVDILILDECVSFNCADSLVSRVALTEFGQYKTIIELLQLHWLKLQCLVFVLCPDSADKCLNCLGTNLEPSETSKQPLTTRYLGHETGYQPIRDQYFLIRSFPGTNPSVGNEITPPRKRPSGNIRGDFVTKALG